MDVTPHYDLDEVSAPASAFMAPGSEESEKVSEAYDQRRLDIAALDDNGEVVVAVEAERVNNDSPLFSTPVRTSTSSSTRLAWSAWPVPLTTPEKATVPMRQGR